MSDDMEVDVILEKQKNGPDLIKISRKGQNKVTKSWWTKNEAEELFFRLEKVLFKE